jgi:polyketide cyclase/dehydrase/lipid transport protein
LASERRAARPSFAATVETEIGSRRETVFNYIVPIDLASIFTGYGPLPSVSGTENQTGAWDAPGRTRTVRLSGGSSAQERITRYEFPRSFSYTVSDFTGVLRLFTTSADGEWWFDSGPSSNGTSVRWRYAFNSRSPVAVPILWLIANFLWRGYMRKAILLAKGQIER